MEAAPQLSAEKFIPLGSLTMTKVRVLSGMHAGAFVDWIHPLLRVGADEDHDIYIGDWNAQTIHLVRTPEGTCEAQWRADGGALAIEGSTLDGDTHRRALRDLEPVRFGAVILCIGPDDSSWPDDADLLQRLFSPPEPLSAPVADPPRRRVPLMALSITAMTLAVSAAVVAVNRPSHELIADSATEPAVASLRRVLSDKRWPDLEVAEQSNRYVVWGVLDTRPDVIEVHQRLDGLLLDKPVVRHFLAAAAIADLVHESVPDAELEVNRTGARSFLVTGSAKRIDHAQSAMLRLAADLSPLGLTVDSTIEPLVVSSARISGTLTDNDGVSYARTRDGVKHIVMPTYPAPPKREPRTALAR